MKRLLLCGLAPLFLLACGGAPAGPAEAPGAPAGEAGAEEAADGTAEGPAAEGSDEGAAAEAAEEASEGGVTTPPADETPRQAKRRVKKGRLAQCKAVGEAMQNVQQRVTITNVTDKETLRRVSGELTDLARDMAKIKIEPELTDLQKLRDDYVGTARAMAGDFKTAAETTDIEKQKKTMADFREREAKSREFVPRLNEVCNAPLE